MTGVRKCSGVGRHAFLVRKEYKEGPEWTGSTAYVRNQGWCGVGKGGARQESRSGSSPQPVILVPWSPQTLIR